MKPTISKAIKGRITTTMRMKAKKENHKQVKIKELQEKRKNEHTRT